MSSAAAPGPHPISSTWSAGWGSMKSTAQRIRAGICCATMRPPCQNRGAAITHQPIRVNAVADSRSADRVGVLGARGKVGSEVCRAVEAADDLELVAAGRRGRRPAAASWTSGAQVVVDFTHPDVVMDHLALCIEHGIHAVVGTTGFDDDRLAHAARASSATSRAAACWSPPTSPSARS